MSEPYLGEIRMFGGDFAPADWALCDGQIMAIPQNDALFSLIGTTYGGDGRLTYALPDVRGRIPVHTGNGYVLGQKGGSEDVTLTVQQLPAHDHQPLATTGAGTTTSPVNNIWAGAAGANIHFSGTPGLSPLNSNTLASVGGSQPHNNMMPYVAVSFIVALYGVYPS